MAVAWLLTMDAAGGGWTTVSRCVGKGGGRGGSLGMRWGGVGACWNGWRTHAVGGFFGAVGPSALALSPTFWFLGGWPCAPPLLLPPYPPLSSTEVAPRPVPPARGVPNRGTGVTAATSVPLRPPCSTATLSLHYLSRAVWRTARPYDYGATNPAARPALFCCVCPSCVLFLLGPPDDGEIASLRGFHVLLFSLCPWWGGGARARRSASTEPDACRHLLDRPRAGPGSTVGTRRVQDLTPVFFLWHETPECVPGCVYTYAPPPRPHRAVWRAPCPTGGAATPSARSSPSHPGASQPQRHCPSLLSLPRRTRTNNAVGAAARASARPRPTGYLSPYGRWPLTCHPPQ